MPNRIIKESICTSESVDGLTWFEEAFFYRLIVNCDDYGRMDARPAILKSRLFPLKSLTDKQIGDALNKLSSAGIVTTYMVEAKPYLQIVAWNCHQQVRNKKSKFPSPLSIDGDSMTLASNCNQLISTASNCTRNPIQSESESLSESLSENTTTAAARATEIGEVFRVYQSNINPICSTIEQDDIADLVDRYSAQWVIAAITEAVRSGVRKLSYIRPILERWRVEGTDEPWLIKKERQPKGKGASSNSRMSMIENVMRGFADEQDASG